MTHCRLRLARYYGVIMHALILIVISIHEMEIFLPERIIMSLSGSNLKNEILGTRMMYARRFALN